MEKINSALHVLSDYVRERDFKGGDPYDLLNSEFEFKRLNKNILFLFTQVYKRLPIDLRPLLKVKNSYSPKALGNLLNAYCKIYNYTCDKAFLSIADRLYHLLLQLKSEGYKDYCWGLNFSYASRGGFFEAKVPCITVTAIIHEAMYEYYKTTKKEEVLNILRSSCNFLLNDLPRTNTGKSICFSYFPTEKDICFNANAMAAEMFARMYCLTGEHKWRECAELAMRFTIEHQKEDGHWNYRKYEDGSEKKQIDFHQGNIIHSLKNYIKYLSKAPKEFEKAMVKGAEFYYNHQFKNNGRSFYRLPSLYPIDIHSQAQGIRVFAELKNLSDKYFNFAKVIAEWTIDNMQSKDGFFIYRKGRVVNYNQSYIRWGQSWMLLALITLLNNSEQEQ